MNTNKTIICPSCSSEIKIEKAISNVCQICENKLVKKRSGKWVSFKNKTFPPIYYTLYLLILITALFDWIVNHDNKNETCRTISSGIFVSALTLIIALEIMTGIAKTKGGIVYRKVNKRSFYFAVIIKLIMAISGMVIMLSLF